MRFGSVGHFTEGCNTRYPHNRVGFVKNSKPVKGYSNIADIFMIITDSLKM